MSFSDFSRLGSTHGRLQHDRGKKQDHRIEPVNCQLEGKRQGFVRQSDGDILLI